MLNPGTRIGSYEIVSTLGAGGMGEVFRATDMRLNRPVAIKFLTTGVASEDGQLRFEREAQLASALNHPHIVSVYDVGNHEGRPFIVTELVDGGTLAEWSAGQGRTWREVLDLLVGVADGIAAAHGQGILHRDIKPANILVSATGIAKLSDFGLAKLTQPSAAHASDAVTVLDARTTPGVLLGTVEYMSPEQAAGRVADARSDIFAFGVVLYELLAGHRPFTGKSALDVLHAIVNSPVTPLTTVRRDVPAPLSHAVDKALEKDPSHRYQSMRELAVDLRRALRQDADARTSTRRVTVYAAGVALLAVVILAAVQFSRRSSQAPRLREPQRITAFSDFAVQPSVSRDGRMLTFIRGAEGDLNTRGEVYVKVLPSGEPLQLTHDGLQKMVPVFSPDGNRIAYTVVTNQFSWDTWVVPVLGGQPRPWLPNASGLQWIDPTHLLFSEIKSGIHMALVTSTESRTDARDVYVPESSRGMAHRSYRSPDGRYVLVTQMNSGGMVACRLIPFEGGEAQGSRTADGTMHARVVVARRAVDVLLRRTRRADFRSGGRHSQRAVPSNSPLGRPKQKALPSRPMVSRCIHRSAFRDKRSM